jgi:hypothetical protein
MDERIMDDLEVFVRECMKRYHRLPPALLAPPLREQFASMVDYSMMRLPYAFAPRFHRATGELAILAGWLSFRLHDRGQAAVDWALAEALATNAGDQSLRAFALISRSNLFSATWGASSTSSL